MGSLRFVSYLKSIICWLLLNISKDQNSGILNNLQLNNPETTTNLPLETEHDTQYFKTHMFALHIRTLITFKSGADSKNINKSIVYIFDSALNDKKIMIFFSILTCSVKMVFVYF